MIRAEHPVVAFRGTIRILGINPYVQVSAARARAIRPAWRRPMPVLVRVNGEPRAKPWRINMMPMGTGAFYLYLHGSVRSASKTKVGDRVEVEVQFDSAYRGGPPQRLPVWFSASLNRNLAAKSAWKALTPSRQKEIIRYLSALKSADSRARNLARAMEMLAGTKGRYMGRTW